MIDILGNIAGLPPIRTHEICTLSSQLTPAALDDEVVASWGKQGVSGDVSAFWAAAREAYLFTDFEYRQWGLHLMSPGDSRKRTEYERGVNPERYRDGDVVLGEFLGDQELLVVAPLESGERRILIALPLDPREGWYGVAPSLVEFLERFLSARGDKFWERKS